MLSAVWSRIAKFAVDFDEHSLSWSDFDTLDELQGERRDSVIGINVIKATLHVYCVTILIFSFPHRNYFYLIHGHMTIAERFWPISRPKGKVEMKNWKVYKLICNIKWPDLGFKRKILTIPTLFPNVALYKVVSKRIMTKSQLHPYHKLPYNT